MKSLQLSCLLLIILIFTGCNSEFQIPDSVNDGNFTENTNNIAQENVIDISETYDSEAYIPETGSKKNKLPDWLKLVPALLVILLALLSRQIIPALIIGIFAGIWIVNGLAINELIRVPLRFADSYLIDILIKRENMSILIFSLMISATIHTINKTGGIKAIVFYIKKIASGRQKAKLTTYFLGWLIFFDDYTNALVVGNTMKSITSVYRISKEKLAYIVDTTSAPLTGIAFISTWIGAQLGYIQSGMDASGIEASAFNVFFNGLKYAFYPLISLFLLFILILNKRDFGPMYRAENKEINDNLTDINSKTIDKPSLKALLFILPLTTLIIVTITAMFISGYTETVKNIENESIISIIALSFGNSDPYRSLLWSSFSALSLTIIMIIAGRVTDIKNLTKHIYDGFSGILLPLSILVLAWILASISAETGTAEYIATLISGNLHPEFLPALLFITASVIAFATGSSWGTMAILYPLFLPAAYSLSISYGLNTEQSMEVFYMTVAAILGGSIFGDHSSPVSDTTILSAMSSGCELMSHVETQLPYALTAAFLSIILFLVFPLFGLHWMLTMLAGFAFTIILVMVLGKKQIFTEKKT